MCVYEGRKKEMYVYYGFCTILSHRETDGHPSRHAYCMGGKYQFFQSNVENLFVNQMKNDNTLTQYIITNKPPVNTVAGTQTISF